MFLKTRTYDNGKPILYGLNQMRAPYGVTMNGDDVQLDKENKRAVQEGSFVVQVGNKVRFLPRARANAAITTTLPTIVLKSTSQYFLAGDVIHMVAGFGEVTFTGAVASGDTAAIKLGDVLYTVTSPGASLPALAAAFITANTVALTAAGINVTQKGTSATLVIVAKDSYAITTSTSSGALTIAVNTTEPGFLGDNILPLGTILSIAPAVANGTRTVTLAAPAAYNVPMDVPVGVMVGKYIGIYPDPIDFTETPKEHIAPIVEADGVYEHNLPYVDEQLKRRFEDLRIEKRFYKKMA